jgi:hypothetical protein
MGMGIGIGMGMVMIYAVIDTVVGVFIQCLAPRCGGCASRSRGGERGESGHTVYGTHPLVAHHAASRVRRRLDGMLRGIVTFRLVPWTGLSG